ncbi:MAG: polysaccharide biosynthesis tyrosine autokinase [Actinomycetota bacterium]
MTDPNTDNQSRTSGFELRDYFRILWLRKWTAILVLTLVLTSALFLSYQQTPIYEAEATVQIPPDLTFTGGTVAVEKKTDAITESQVAASPLMGFYASELLKGEVLFGSQIVITEEGSTGAAVEPEPTPTGSPAPDDEAPEDEIPLKGEELDAEQVNAGYEFLRGVQVQPARQSSELLVVRVRDEGPSTAQTKATALSLGYLGFKREQAVVSARVALAQLIGDKALAVADRNEIIRIANEGGTTPNTTQVDQQISGLESQIAGVQQAISGVASLGDILFQARVPKRPTLPNHVRDGAFAFIIGLILGIGAAFLRDYVDDSLKGVDDVERQSGAPLIGVVPHVPAARGIGEHAGRNGKRSYLVTLDDPKAPSSEAYRTLRTNLLFMSVSGPVGKLLVTSPVAGEGKTTTAANLAVVLAQAGQRVLLVGADLRRPSVHRHFGVTNRIGLSSVLSGQASLLEAVNDPGIRGLRVMSGGPIPPNPTELLGSLAMKDFLDQAAQVTDWVILDAPPVLGLADAAVLATLCDATLFVVNETTNRRVLAHARDQLAKVRARVVGTVLNNFGPAFSYYYSDYYAYTSQYYLQEPEQANGKASRRERKRQAREAAEPGEAGFIEATDGRTPPEERIPSQR